MGKYVNRTSAHMVEQLRHGRVLALFRALDVNCRGGFTLEVHCAVWWPVVSCLAAPCCLLCRDIPCRAMLSFPDVLRRCCA